MSCTGNRYDFCITAGNTFDLTFGVTDSNYAPIDLTNHSGIAPIFSNYGGSLLGYFNVDILEPQTSGIVLISLTKEESALLPVINAVYQIDFRSDFGEEIKYLKGNLEIYPQLSITNIQ